MVRRRRHPLVECLQRIFPAQRIDHLQRLLSSHDMTLWQAARWLGLDSVIDVLVSDDDNDIASFLKRCKQRCKKQQGKQQRDREVATNVIMDLDNYLFRELMDFIFSLQEKKK